MASQRGAVLIVSLLFLVVLTMLGVTAMTSTTFEERMAGNARDAAVAMHAAESALGKARTWFPLGSTPAAGNFAPASANGVCTAGFCKPRIYKNASDRAPLGTVLPAIPSNVDWSERADSGSTTLAFAGSTDPLRLRGVSRQARYIIEMFCMDLALGSISGPTDSCRFWRFTAVGFGRNPNTQVTVQEVFLSSSVK
jgi:type IV pilus assembly protein PilX